MSDDRDRIGQRCPTLLIVLGLVGWLCVWVVGLVGWVGWLVGWEEADAIFRSCEVPLGKENGPIGLVPIVLIARLIA